jgi:hypothetical protein
LPCLAHPIACLICPARPCDRRAPCPRPWSASWPPTSASFNCKTTIPAHPIACPPSPACPCNRRVPCPRLWSASWLLSSLMLTYGAPSCPAAGRTSPMRQGGWVHVQQQGCCRWESRGVGLLYVTRWVQPQQQGRCPGRGKGSKCAVRHRVGAAGALPWKRGGGGRCGVRLKVGAAAAAGGVTLRCGGGTTRYMTHVT